MTFWIVASLLLLLVVPWVRTIVLLKGESHAQTDDYRFALLPLMAAAGRPTTVTLEVKNMTCSPPNHRQKVAGESLGVTAVKVDTTKTATVTYEPERLA